ncbi:hypothetical protein IQ13_3226 [Lacibacter cauensis]|uniref:Uncharacterized protein n=1 Tax=Lacibacter cauensis TaxID=510947 RepID=A0A562SHB8_9BACT|nr:hypothetical protein [Lacibacter cauensis]TWI80548.1 hypothetical protein IQ13_3226 [Lacibacter cauensis]
MPKKSTLTPVQELHNFVVMVQELRRLQDRRKVEKNHLLDHAITVKEKEVDQAIALHMMVQVKPKSKPAFRQSAFNNFLAR